MQKSGIYSIIAGVLALVGVGLEIKAQDEKLKELEQASEIHWAEKDDESEKDPE